MKNPLSRFLVRWFVCSLGLWLAANLLGDRISYGSEMRVVIIAGLLLAALNTVIRPVIVLFSLPAIVLTLGLFNIVVNAFMVLLASWLYEPLQVNNFWAAALAGIIIGLVNWLVTTILDKDD
jgi:putative membrane protein